MTDSRHRVAACVWRIRPEVVLALDDRFGEPVDTYVNGSHVWLRDDGPSGAELEWRLHPVAGLKRPPGMGVYDMLDTVLWALRGNGDLAVPLAGLWGGLEAFVCDGADVEPVPLAAAATQSLGLTPDAFGMVDHEAIGDRVEATNWQVSVIDALIEQLRH